MEEHQFFGGDWRTRSPDADQEYFIDKMRMLKIKLRKYEDENRLLYRCLAERKTDVKEALRDKCLVINNVQYEMSELKKHILMLLGVLSEDCDATLVASPVPTTSQEQQQPQPQPQCHQSEMDKTIWLTRNKSLEENFKKALKKVKELERQVGQLTETVEELNKDREDLIEKNSFIEEENNIQREQIALLEDTVKDLEDVALKTVGQLEEAETQTETSGAELQAILDENVEEILLLVNKYQELEGRYEKTKEALVALQTDFHERGRLMSELENEVNGLKLRDSSVFIPSAFLSPSSSRSNSSNSSADFEDDDSGVSLGEDSADAKKVEVRKFIRNLQIRRRMLHDRHRGSMCSGGCDQEF